MQFKYCTIEIDGPVSVLRLDHQEVMNAVSMDMLGGLSEALDAIEDRKEEVRCVVLTGAGSSYVNACKRILAEVGEAAGTFLHREEFAAAMSELARLRRPVDDFFDKVTVNCDDVALRENRLRLLSRIRATLNQVADFSQIEG